jgi:amidophosphoribosyltransferase
MMEQMRHNCGLAVAHSLETVYNLTESLQHRGREAAGIAAIGHGRIDAIKWKGTVNRFELEDLHKIFPGPNYHTFLGHVRYATRGRKDRILEDAHPHVIGGKINKKGNHVLITDCDMAIVHNGQVDRKYLGDVENCSKTGCDSETLLHFYKEHGEQELLKKIPGAYTMAIADKSRKELIVVRDRTGIKPGVLGFKNGKYVVASEDIAIRKNGGRLIEDLDLGHIYYLSPEGGCRKEKVVRPKKKFCFFEFNYLSDAESVQNGVSVGRLRKTLGEQLAKEFNPDDVDMVTFLPRCPEPAARSYAKKTGKPFGYTFYKMKSERAFQGSTPDDRKASIDQNLHLLDNKKDALKGKVVVNIDDSTVRGNNLKRVLFLLQKEAGVKKFYHVNYTPPLGVIGDDEVRRGCEFGVDMPPDDDFIARGRTPEEISKMVGTEVVYISVDGMLKSFEKVGIPREHLCTYCIGGQHPFE